MSNENLKLIIENKKPTELVREIESETLTWEQEIEIEEQKIWEEFEPENESIYEAEIAEEVNSDTSENFAYSHLPTSQSTNQFPFLVKIKLENCYLTDASFWGSFLWFHEQVPTLYINKIDGIQDLLEQLKEGKIRIVNQNWGYETERANSLKRNLIKQLKEIISKHENGENIRMSIEVMN